jgi:hypothetical protein
MSKLQNNNHDFRPNLKLESLSLGRSSSRVLELVERWTPVCEDLAVQYNIELPDPDWLLLIIVAANEAMWLLYQLALQPPDRPTQLRMVNQFLIDAFQRYE